MSSCISADGKTILKRDRKIKFFEKHDSYKKKKLRDIKMRNQPQLAIQRQATSDL